MLCCVSDGDCVTLAVNVADTDCEGEDVIVAVIDSDAVRIDDDEPVMLRVCV